MIFPFPQLVQWYGNNIVLYLYISSMGLFGEFGVVCPLVLIEFRAKSQANCLNCSWFECNVAFITQHLWAIICQIIDLCILIFRHWPPCQMIFIHSLTKYQKACQDLQFNIIVQGQLSICLNSIQISIIRINCLFFCSHYLLILSSIFALCVPIHSSLLLFIATALSPLHSV